MQHVRPSLCQGIVLLSSLRVRAVKEPPPTDSTPMKDLRHVIESLPFKAAKSNSKKQTKKTPTCTEYKADTDWPSLGEKRLYLNEVTALQQSQSCSEQNMSNKPHSYLRGAAKMISQILPLD
ncbi:hypothetical protein FKM82_018668 [Ascaphus truei]